MRLAAACVLTVSLLAAGGGFAAECKFTQAQLQSESLEVLRKDYPARQFAAGGTDDLILMGEVQLGLDNLYARLCIEPLDAAARAERIQAHFASMMKLIEQQEAQQQPLTWAAARKLLMLQLTTQDYFRSMTSEDVFVYKSFVPGVLLAVVVDQPEGYGYVRKEDLQRWGVTADALFDEGLINLVDKQASAKLSGADGEEKVLASEEKDGYDAVRILVPWVREEAAKMLGDPFLAAIPNRDFLIMWSTANSAGFQQATRGNIQADFTEQPYALSSRVLRVWANGRIEVE